MRILALTDSVSKMIERGTGQDGGTPTPPASATGSGWSLFLGIIELLVVLGLIAGVIYLLIRYLASKTYRGQDQLMRTISVHPLATNRTIHLVSLEDRIYVVGVGNDVTLLDIITDEDMVERITSQSLVTGAPGLPDWMPKWLPIRKNSDAGGSLESIPFYEALQSKLQQIKDQRKKIREWDTDENE